MKYYFFFILAPFFSYADLSWFLSKKDSSHKWAVIPSYKRTEALGHVLGGRVFIYPEKKPGFYLSTSMHWSPQKEHQLAYKGRWIYWTQNHREISVQAELGRFYDFIYQKSSRIESPVQKIFINGLWLFPLKESLELGGVLEFRQRNETKDPCFLISSKKKTPHLCPKTPQNRASAVGLAFRQDTRDNIFNPQSGFLIQSFAKAGYELVSKVVFAQVSIQTRWIYSFLKDSKWVLSAAAGQSYAENNSAFPYSYQFKLGGADSLRGYLQDRFHAAQYYLIQNEFRQSLFAWLEPLVFVDLGHVHWTKKPKITAGIGLRVGWPPSYQQRLRVELGWAGKSQYNFVVAFAQPY